MWLEVQRAWGAIHSPVPGLSVPLPRPWDPFQGPGPCNAGDQGGSQRFSWRPSAASPTLSPASVKGGEEASSWDLLVPALEPAYGSGAACDPEDIRRRSQYNRHENAAVSLARRGIPVLHSHWPGATASCRRASWVILLPQHRLAPRKAPFQESLRRVRGVRVRASGKRCHRALEAERGFFAS